MKDANCMEKSFPCSCHHKPCCRLLLATESMVHGLCIEIPCVCRTSGSYIAEVMCRSHTQYVHVHTEAQNE